MARLILKSPYLKCGGSNFVSGYLRYIGTRERVELIPDDRPPTRKQEQLITKLVKDFLDSKKLDEYSDYETKPTKANASAFITRALEENWSAVQQSDGYMKYIATRPRAERLGDHGLFGDEDGVDLEQTMDELDHYTGNVWTHIISLKRGDAARLGYDNARAWMNLLRANRNDIAAAMNIPPNHFRWYAAYHDEGDHPHVHMMAWSIKSSSRRCFTPTNRNPSHGTNWYGRHARLSENSRKRWHEVSALTLRLSRSWDSWPDSWKRSRARSPMGISPSRRRKPQTKS